jgi:type II secretory ATPase GspE/PulE/Tfp pilus assembly ATPase PilB-like protein
MDLNVAPYLVVSTVEAILAQRLVRRICEQCAEPRQVASSIGRAFGLPPEDLLEAHAGRGCATCRDTGFVGRVGIYELLIINDELKTELRARHGEADVHALAVRAGMRRLREDGLRLIRSGITTPEEVLRVTRA